MFVVISPNDSKSIYPLNTWTNFTVDLPQSIVNARTSYRVGLTHVFFKKSKLQKSPFYHVFSSICDSSVVAGKELALLGTFSEKGAIYSPYYQNLVEDNIQRISITILTPDLSIPTSEDLSGLHLCLHFGPQQ